METVKPVRISLEKKPDLLGHQIREFGFTGVLIDAHADRVQALLTAVAYFKLYEPCFSAEACRRQATKFSFEAFRAGWEQVISESGLQAKAPVKVSSAA